MSDYEIIPFSPAYAKDFERLNVAWLKEYFVVEPLDEKVLGDPERYIIAPGGHIWLAKIADEIVGTISLIKDGETYEISKMAVHNAYQGRGIAKALMQQVLDYTRSLGLSSIYLLTSSRLGTANKIYEKFGFVKCVPTAEDLAHYARCDTRWEYHF
jgi:ribosomal protein S18 acetylase RimI-like enzyme